jgi:hypothetical protein
VGTTCRALASGHHRCAAELASAVDNYHCNPSI